MSHEYHNKLTLLITQLMERYQSRLNNERKCHDITKRDLLNIRGTNIATYAVNVVKEQTGIIGSDTHSV